ncbi:MAG: spermidine/putrescine ABC transporter ATP-binding protein [Chloroflexi bacterium HGW-Chloroflexi-3]|nr:MAG: spermidine/putrescine ABC transporter ATP-binding protein [Chloroflexi bacterium HGW-Chloroflexi-3]
MLSVKSLYKEYENQPLLEGVSFDIQKGETICLLGRSGSGKSTLLRIIAGIEAPESGDVYWNNQNLKDIPVHKRQFGFMFQDYALFPHKNVFENVAFGLKMQNLPFDLIEEKVNLVLDKVKMQKFRHRQVADLSGGEKQRVALARALAPEPRLLMLDEPLGALDRNLREQLMDELRLLLHESNIPAIYVTHDQEEAFTIGDRLVLLNEGRIIQNATPEDVYQNPKNAWVAKFIGLSNLLEGVIQSIQPLRVITKSGDFSIQTGLPKNVKLGDPVILLLRPDALTLNDEKMNQFQAHILDDVFLGNQWRVKLRMGDMEFSFLVDEPISIGSIIKISIDPKRINLLQAEK